MHENARLIHQVMVALGFERDRRNTRGLQFHGTLRTNNIDIGVEILFPDDTLTRLPKLRLLDRAQHFAEVVAHIEDKDRICYAQEIEMQLDPYAVDASVTKCIRAMTDTLSRMLSKDLEAEVEAEFPQHWRGEARFYVAESWPKSGDGILMPMTRKHDTIMVLGASPDSLTRFGANADQKILAKKNGIPVRVIRMKNPMTFRKPLVQPTNLAGLLRWAAAVEFDLDKKIEVALAAQPVSSMRVFLSAANGVIGAIAIPPPHLIKAHQRNSFVPYLIATHAAKIPITRLAGDRADEQFVIGRSLSGQPGLDGKRIAVVGLGTIGGHLAKLIAQAGAGMNGGRLALFDQQIFTPGNVGRHILGLAAVGFNKAIACHDLLSNFYPGISVSTFTDDALEQLAELARYDFVIDATGDHPTSVNINKHFVDIANGGSPVPTRLHVWLEGNGVAARALAVDAGSACLDCLTKLDGMERFPVLRPDHPAAITPADCGEGAFFAYGPGASPIAAGLAAQMTLGWAAGSISPHFRTIRIVENATFQCKDQDPKKLDGCRACAT